MRSLKIFCVIVCILYGQCFIVTCYAQSYGSSFENITSKDGVTDRIINCIIQDVQGFIWIGSADGLTRYDGYTCVAYRHSENDQWSISDNEVNALCTDDEGTLWIGTRNGLNRYDARNDRFDIFLHDEKNKNSLSSNEIFALAKDNDGNIWIGTYGGGLDKITKVKSTSNKALYQFKHYKHTAGNNSISNDQIFSICFDDASRAWIGTSGGLNLLLPGSEKFIRFYHQDNNKTTISNNMVYKICADKNGAMWLCGKNMLDKITLSLTDPSRITVEHFLYKFSGETQADDWSINNCMVDKKGNVWVATNDEGLFKMKLSNNNEVISCEQFTGNSQISYSLASSNVYYLFEDRSGAIWIGTSKGVSKYIPEKSRFNEANLFDKVSLPQNRFVMALLSDKQNRFWFAYDADTLHVISKEKNKFSLNSISLISNQSNSGQINSLYQSAAGDIYIGTLLQGLFIIPASSQNIFYKTKWIRIDREKYSSLPSNNIYSIAEDKHGIIWIGTYKGLCSYNPKSKQLQPVYVSPKAVVFEYVIKALCFDDNNAMWMGTDNGLFLVKDGIIQQSFKNNPNDSNTISNNKITAIHFDRNKNIWIGTKGGLNFFDAANQKFKRYTVKNGLINDFIRSIKEDSRGNLWIATNHGLIKYDLIEKKFYTYETEDGLCSDEFMTNSAASDSSGIFYFGTNNGLVSFDPLNIHPNQYKPPVVITAVKVMNQPIESFGDSAILVKYRKEKKLVLHYNQNFFSFEFAALNYINSQKNQYAFMLEGVDHDWNYSGSQRFAGYTDIKPGNYTFKVKASNNDGIWNDIPVTIAVIIIPPWWQTWWFYSVCFVLASSLIYLVYRIRVKQILKLYKLRSSIAKDLHDDVGSALSSIALLSKIAEEEKINARLKPEEILFRIGNTSKKMIDLMDDIVWSVNPDNDRFSNMLVRMREYAAEMLEARNINFTFTINENIDAMKIPMQMRKDYFLIFKEAVNNLAKYSNCNKASVLIEHYNRSIITTIADDGNGFDETIIHSGNGLKNMRARADALKGKIEIHSAKDKGTIVTLIMPVT